MKKHTFRPLTGQNAAEWSRLLASIRCGKNLTQMQMARRAGTTVVKIDCVERGYLDRMQKDTVLRILEEYLDSLHGIELHRILETVECS